MAELKVVTALLWIFEYLTRVFSTKWSDLKEHSGVIGLKDSDTSPLAQHTQPIQYGDLPAKYVSNLYARVIQHAGSL